jgi:hypothetical protein
MLFVTRNASETQVDLLVARASTTVFGVIMISFVLGFASCALGLMVRRLRRGDAESHGTGSAFGRTRRRTPVVVDEI